MAEVISHDTLKPILAQEIAESTGWKQVQETVLKEARKLDVHFYCDSVHLVLELEIGTERRLFEAIAQADSYRESTGADGIIAVVYPEEARMPIGYPQDATDIALSIPFDAIVLAPFLRTHKRRITLPEFCTMLQAASEMPLPEPSVDTIVQAIREAVMAISLEVRRETGIESPVIKKVVGSFDLFRILSAGEAQEVDQESLKLAAADLAAYILINQLVLYHILSEELKDPWLPPINWLSSIDRIQSQYFDRVTNINYKPIYAIDVATCIPKRVLPVLNLTISAIRALHLEMVKHDLLGRVFHDLLPPETQKLLGAFYTKPVAAEILAHLAVQHGADRVLDPACGSGTLLVAAYRAKKEKEPSRAHRLIVEKEITGVDIMPFASHLTALNLTVQSPQDRTNKVRVGITNSLSLKPESCVSSISQFQEALFPLLAEPERYQEMGLVDMGAGEEEFQMGYADLVIMNPPFTKKERLRNGMKPKGQLRKWLGEQNYWAYFIGLADSFLDEGGLLAAVVPMDFFRGKYSKQVRSWLFTNKIGAKFRVKYIIKTVKDVAFSEQSKFRDFLVVLVREGDVKPDSKFALVYVKRRIDDMNLVEARTLALEIAHCKQGATCTTDDVAIEWIAQEEVLRHCDDLWPIVGFTSPETRKNITAFHARARKQGAKKLATCSKLLREDSVIIRGYEPSGAGKRAAVWIVRDLAPERRRQAGLLFQQERNKFIKAQIKNADHSVRIPKQSIAPALKTHSYITSINFQHQSDFLLLSDFKSSDALYNTMKKGVDFEELQSRTKVRAAHLIIARRPDLAAPGTSLLAFYSDEGVIPSDMFWAVKVTKAEAKHLAIWFNSIVALANIMLSRKETRGSFSQIDEHVLERFYVLDAAKLDRGDKTRLTRVFNKYQYSIWPSLVEQMSDPPYQREAVDRAVLATLGFTDKQIAQMLEPIYKAVHKELKTLLESMK